MDIHESFGHILMEPGVLTASEVVLRLLLCVIIAGIIGLERGTHGHTAGFRTYILVCSGACMAMMTNQYVVTYLGAFSDLSRLGAAVITGVGFLGVGTIIVTGRHRIKGLTTAAGLWAVACLGLAIGVGFYFGAILAAVLIFTALALLPRMEGYFYERSRMADLYAEIRSPGALKDFKSYGAKEGINICKVHLSQDVPMTQGAASIYFTVRVPRGRNKSEIINYLENQDFVYFVEEV